MPYWLAITILAFDALLISCVMIGAMVNIANPHRQEARDFMDAVYPA